MYDNSDELMHYGRKGMKWYQNIFTAGKKAGSGTRKKTTAAKSDKEKAKAAREKEKQTRKAVENARNNPAKYKSSDELRKAIDHMRLEKDYNQLLAETTKVSGGKAWCKKFGKEALSPAVITAGRNVLTKAFEKLGNKMFGLEGAKEVRDELDDLKREAEIWKSKENIERSKRYLKGDDADGNQQSGKSAGNQQSDKNARNQQSGKDDGFDAERAKHKAERQAARDKAAAERAAKNEADRAKWQADMDKRVQDARDYVKQQSEAAKSSRSRSDDVIYDVEYTVTYSDPDRSAGRNYVSALSSSSSRLLLPGGSQPLLPGGSRLLLPGS